MNRPDILTRRRAWFDGQIDLAPERLVFIDETWAKTNMARTHGRAPRGERLRMGFPHGHWKSTTCVGRPDHARHDRPLRAHRGDQPRCLRGLCREGARPRVAPRRHRDHGQPIQPQGAAHPRADRGRGGQPAVPPALQPRLQPDREGVAKLKSLLRKAAERTIEALWAAIGRFADAFTPAKCANYFSACGYDPDW